MRPEIFIVDDRHPEDMAMLQALYSRSPASVVDHLEKLKKAGSGKFMDQYYVGYGHASIGDCGQTTCFVEQVSMLVAKAIQENPLYNGQEASTRYLDYSKQEVLDPYNNPASAAIQAKWKEIYETTLAKLIAGLEKAHPYNEAEYKTEKVWHNTLNARGFDIARSLLPLGTTTLLSWSTSLRQARDHLRRLKYHPLPEVYQVAKEIFLKLVARYPHSFRAEDIDIECANPRDLYARDNAARNSFQSPHDIQRRFHLTDEEQKSLRDGEIVIRRDAIDLDGVRDQESNILATRPRGAHLPWRMESYGSYNFVFLLDFGSFRDIQRHRNGVCQIPLVDARFGIHPWYLQQFETLLSPQDFATLQADIAAQVAAVGALASQGVTPNDYENQYYYPMGMQAMVHVAYSVPETVYVGELRSGKTVHGSLRPIAQKFLDILSYDLPGIALYGDMALDDWTAKRGEQTIASKVG
ncbi:MAG: FAD-dependent thymidylate synthase [Alphaproteobacteria bacterium]|nr:FAD-dependent thymidylate synthase [Alphaproteobacteria bacterium]